MFVPVKQIAEKPSDLPAVWSVGRKWTKRTMMARSALCLLTASLLLPPPALLGQESAGGRSCGGSALNLGVRCSGLSFGNSHWWNGLRFNALDRDVERINGINVTFWRHEDNDRAEYNGLSVGVVPDGGSFRGLTIGIGGAVADHGFTGLNIGGLGLISNGTVTGVNVAGLGLVANGSLTGINIGGLGAVAEGDMLGINLGGLGAVSSGSIAGISVGGLGSASSRAGR
jgi:hypothetical protein